ncbi:hypothetical protein TcasGA2_TC006741 [Tribolium castaneum]|uniref:Uncharacterized protein n=1 Tax=Tribolium castaneum TaxID=7070 RepID=D6WZ01_TRICA|nr:hypothetical protein TcasGA2_TC006741 [Tribolium castaneum]
MPRKIRIKAFLAPDRCIPGAMIFPNLIETRAIFDKGWRRFVNSRHVPKSRPFTLEATVSCFGNFPTLSRRASHRRKFTGRIIDSCRNLALRRHKNAKSTVSPISAVCELAKIGDYVVAEEQTSSGRRNKIGRYCTRAKFKIS